MGVNVIVPVVDEALFQFLLESIAKNTVKPSHIFIVNNTCREDFCMRTTRLLKKINVHYVIWTPLDKDDNFVMKGVNESWNLGVYSEKHNCDCVSILNEDIILSEHFFESVLNAFKIQPKCGITFPATTIKTPDFIYSGVCTNENLNHIKRREGWAFTIKTSLLQAIPPIPLDVSEMFCGDDWFWWWMQFYGYASYRDNANRIYHRVGVSRETGKGKLWNDQFKAERDRMMAYTKELIAYFEALK